MLARNYRLFTIAALVALASCDGGESPLSPAGDPAVPESEDAAAPAAELVGDPDQTLAALTGQRIAFSSNRTGTRDIYLMDPQGTQLKRITTAAAVESEPAWSWDNKRIALVRQRKDASNVTHSDIYIINPDGTNGHWWRPTPSPYNLSSPAWAPDGSEILVTVSLHADVYPAWLNLPGVTLGFYSDGMGGTLKGKDPSYNPAGDHITYVGSQGKTLDVMTVNGNEHKVLLYDPHASLSRPVFSPDGKRIALSMNDTDGRVQIFVRNANAVLVRLTATTTGVNLYPSWSPDGSKITFMSTRIGSNQVWIMSASGANPKRLHISSYDTQPAFSH